MAVFSREALGLIPWVVASWLLATAVSLLLWLARRWSGVGRAALRFLGGEGWLVAPGEMLALLYALGPPYAAMVLGFLHPEPLGLSGFDWWKTLGRGGLLGIGLLLLAWLAWRAYLQAAAPPAGLLARSQRLVALPAGRVLFLLWAAAEQFHWAFYRVLPTLLLGFEAGLWMGLILVVAERYVAPQTTARLRQPGGVEEEAWWLTKLFAMTVTFAVLRNMWVCIALHALMEGMVGWLLRRRGAGPAAQPSLIWSGNGLEEETAAAPALVLAAGTALALLVLFTWGAARPAGPAPAVPAAVVQPASPNVPTPTTAATPSPTAAPVPTPRRTPVVRAGDSLNEISRIYDVSVDLMQLNGIADPTSLQVGQVLIIP